MSKYASAREDGLFPYVVTVYHWSKSYNLIEYAANLRDAKARYGYARMLHESRTVRRSRVEDMPTDGGAA